MSAKSFHQKIVALIFTKAILQSSEYLRAAGFSLEPAVELMLAELSECMKTARMDLEIIIAQRKEDPKP